MNHLFAAQAEATRDASALDEALADEDVKRFLAEGELHDHALAARAAIEGDAAALDALLAATQSGDRGAVERALAASRVRLEAAAGSDFGAAAADALAVADDALRRFAGDDATAADLERKTAAVLALVEGAGDDDEPPAGVAVAVADLRSALDKAGLGERHADVVAAAADALVSVEAAAAERSRRLERRAHEAELEAAAAERKRRRDGAEAALLGDVGALRAAAAAWDPAGLEAARAAVAASLEAAVEAGADDSGDAVAEARAAAAAARALAHALDDVDACRSAIDALERAGDPGPAAALGILGDDDDVDGDGLEAVAKRLAKAGRALRADAPPALTAFFGDAVERAKRRAARGAELREAMLSRDLDRLRAAEAAAAEAGVVVDLAKTVGSELEEERDAKRAVAGRAAAAEDVGASAAPLTELRPALDALDAALGACKARFGFDEANDADCRDAARARDRLAARRSARSALRRERGVAARSRDATNLEALLTRVCVELGVDEACAEVAAGEELATELRAEATALHRLRDAAERASDGDLDASGRAAALVELRAAVEVCEQLGAAADGLDVAAAAARLQRLEDEDGAGAALRRAAADDDGEALEAALEAARRVAAEGGDGDADGPLAREIAAAEAALAACDRGEANASVERGRLAAAREASDARARAERAIVDAIAAGGGDGAPGAIGAALDAALDLGLFDSDAVFEGRAALRRADARRRAAAALEAAAAAATAAATAASRVDRAAAVARLSAALRAAEGCGVAEDARAAAVAVRARLEAARAAADAVADAVERADIADVFEAADVGAALDRLAEAAAAVARLGDDAALVDAAERSAAAAAAALLEAQRGLVGDLRDAAAARDGDGAKEALAAVDAFLRERRGRFVKLERGCALCRGTSRLVASLDAERALRDVVVAGRAMLARSRGADGSSASATADVVERTADAAAAARDAGDVDGRLLEEAGALLVALEEAAATLRDAHGVDGGGLASFRKLRRPADYAEGLASAAEKQRALRRRFVHEAVPLHTSQLVLGGKALDAARACHRDILGFCGDVFMSYPEAMAANLAAHGFGGPEDLRDEIFVQLAKQASANPSASSAFKCWRLLFLCASTFPPSAELLPILVHFCEAADCQGPPGDHVRDVLDALAPARKVLEAAGGGALEPGALLVPLAPAPPSAGVIHGLLFGGGARSGAPSSSYAKLRRASVDRKMVRLREVGGNMSDLQPLVDMGIVPIELKDVVDGAAATDEDVEAAFEQLEILEHADEVRARFDELIRAAEEAVASEGGARDYHAMDLEAQLNLVQTTKVPGLDVSQIIDAEELVARMYDQLDLQATLAAAVDARDLAGLDEGLARARDMGDAGLARCRGAAELRAKLAPSLQKRLSAFLGL